MDLMALFAVIGTIIGILGTIYAIYTNKKKNDNMLTTISNSSGREIGTILSELGYIKSSVDDIKRKQETSDERYFEMANKLSGFEEWKNNTSDRITKLETEVYSSN